MAQLNRMCLDCTTFNEAHGMYSHPIFQTEHGWAVHQFESHGGPKPKPPVEKPAKEKPVKEKPSAA